MFIIFGRRRKRIKSYTDYHIRCKECGDFTQAFSVYQEYFHIFFIPLFPIGGKTIYSRCTKCGDPFNDEKVSFYLNQTKTPLYLYAGLIAFVSLVAFLVMMNLKTQKQKGKYIENPLVEDVYLIRDKIDNERVYYFLKIKRVDSDSIYLIPGYLQYNKFISNMDKEDFFIKDQEFSLAKDKLKELLEEGVINSVERNYKERRLFHQEK